MICFVLEASTVFRAWFLGVQISRFYLLLLVSCQTDIFQILGSVPKGCPLLEYIDLYVNARENPLHAELIALSSLRNLRSVFIHIGFSRDSRRFSPKDREDFLVSLDAIVEQGLLEVSFCILN